MDLGVGAFPQALPPRGVLKPTQKGQILRSLALDEPFGKRKLSASPVWFLKPSPGKLQMHVLYIRLQKEPAFVNLLLE